eukprot:COSAG02_NODE_56137_length_287_cov_0.569149_2_plen_39_part_01
MLASRVLADFKCAEQSTQLENLQGRVTDLEISLRKAEEQ